MKKLFFLFALLSTLLLSSCSIIDAVLPNGIQYHTVVKYNYTDTLTLKKDRFTAKILIQNDSLYIWANYKGTQQSKQLNPGKACDLINTEKSVPLTYIFK